MAHSIRKVSTFLWLNQNFTSQVRFYPRWSHRRPLRVLSNEEYEEMQNKPKKTISQGAIPQHKQVETAEPSPLIAPDIKPKINWVHSVHEFKIKEKGNDAMDSRIATLGQKRKKKEFKPLTAKALTKTSVDMLETVIDKEGNFVYTKMSNNDIRVGTILTEVKSQNERTKKTIMLEGARVIKEALAAGCHLKYILFSRKDDLDQIKDVLPKVGAHLYKMPYRELQVWSDLTTSPGIIGIFATPNLRKDNQGNMLPLTVICDNIREPGNLGAILRVCAAVGCEKVILTKGCVNVWNTKVIRGAAGTHFKLNICKDVDWSEIEENIHPNSRCFIADNQVVSTNEDKKGEDVDVASLLTNMPVVPYYSVNFGDTCHSVLVVGGETYGVSADSYVLASKMNGVRLNIPLSNNVESLNVGAALATICFELKKQFALRK